MALTPDDTAASRDVLFAAPLIPLSLAYRCDVAQVEERAVVSVRGEIDVATAADLRREMLEALALPVRVMVLDLGYCTFMDSSGCAVLMEVRSTAQAANIELKLTSVPRSVRLVLRLSGLAEQFGLAGGPSSEPATHPRRLAT